MIQIEKALIPNYKDQSPYEWFINQKHIPFDISSDAHGLYYKLYHQFLEELYHLYLKTNSEYYWFNQNGKLIGDKESQVTRYEISSNNIRINKHLLRDIKLEELLKNN
jgi:hypothetical protein